MYKLERWSVSLSNAPTLLQVLEDLLKSFRGCVLAVSHDRAFMDGLAPRLLALRGDGSVRLFDGTYSEVSGCSYSIHLMHHASCQGHPIVADVG